MATTKLVPLQHDVKIVDPATGFSDPYFIQYLQQFLEEKAITDELADEAIQPVDLVTALAALELDDLADVDTSGVADGDGLVFDSGSGLWVPSTLSSATAFERPIVIPATSEYTLQNAGTATIANSTYGMLLTVPTSTSNIRFVRKNGAPPATPYSLIVKARPVTGYSSNLIYKMCIIARNSSNGRIIIFGSEYNNGQHLVQRWTNYTTFSANGLAPATIWGGHQLPWLRMLNNGASLAFARSPDGEQWFTYHTETLATFLTAAGGSCDEIGVGSYMNGLGFTDSCLFQSIEVV